MSGERVRLVVSQVFLAIAALTLAQGCGRTGPALYPIAGVVTFDGQPLPQGAISFDPADGKGSAYAGEILDGKYRVECAPGEKRVSIRASRPSKKPGPDGGPDFEQYLPARYNTRSTLSASVSLGEQNVADFGLTTKAAR